MKSKIIYLASAVLTVTAMLTSCASSDNESTTENGKSVAKATAYVANTEPSYDAVTTTLDYSWDTYLCKYDIRSLHRLFCPPRLFRVA